MEDIRQEWRKVNNGAIEPPLSEDEINAFAEVMLSPEVIIKFTGSRTFEDTAVNALIQCPHFRLPKKPAITAAELITHRID